jgi:hypothetical protein
LGRPEANCGSSAALEREQGPGGSNIDDVHAGGWNSGGASMAWEDGYGHGGAVSEERKNGWRPMRARSSALACARPGG